MEYTTILYEVKDKAACITLNRPDVLNALNPQMFRDLTHAYDRARDRPGGLGLDHHRETAGP